MDPFELLKADHQKVSALFKEINSASEQAKRRIFTQLKNELDLHARIEETIFYPALEKDPKSRDLTLEAYEEHKILKELLAELSSSGISQDEWDAKLTVLQENVEHHVDEEEGELFDKAEDALSDDELERLGDEMAAAKGQAANGGSSSNRSAATARASSSSSKQTKSNGESRGILGTLANLVGLGDSSSKKSSKKRSSSASKGSGTRKSTGGTKKAAAKRAGTKKAAKKSTTKTAASKRSGQRTAAARSTAKRTTRKGAAPRGTKKRSSGATTKRASKAGSRSRARSGR